MEIIIDLCEVTDYSMVRKTIQSGKTFSDILSPHTHTDKFHLRETGPS